MKMLDISEHRLIELRCAMAHLKEALRAMGIVDPLEPALLQCWWDVDLHSTICPDHKVPIGHCPIEKRERFGIPHVGGP